ncbi:dipeptidase [Novilysobacter defluvii]|uniref:Membrane dipeptidase n=1 Tax=Lysobacter defluvii IMMIB APB-9 = DSM 18482 TaxID=1385515 RepID=A0A0A0M949_9GAMM|nr:dipeptidase [Lysobacter defluvii]KGO99595.1 membrane dipeptidase [Lysobacter defluvii IMMIB APB-9 = DSM 18482]
MTRTLAIALALALPVAGWAAEPLTLDSHVDIPRTYMQEARYDAGTDTELRVDLGKMERGGLDAAFFIIYVEQGPLTPEGYAEAIATAEGRYAGIEALLARYPERIRFAGSPAEVRRNHADGVLSAMIGIENGYSLGRSLDAVDRAWERGVRYLGLTHVGHNALCTSSSPHEATGEAPPGAGLTGFGRSVVLRANQLGMMVDISHASDQCVRDVVEWSRAPVIASHSSAHALVPHPRNLNDELLRAVAATGGVVQVVAYTHFLRANPGREAAEEALKQEVARLAGDPEFDYRLHEDHPAFQEGLARIEVEHPPADMDDYMDHVEHVVRVAGIDHVGLASDFDGGGGIIGWEDASQTPNVTAALRERGFTDAQIEKLWSGNFLRVWDEVLARAGGVTR